jgi:hypothetical protein
MGECIGIGLRDLFGLKLGQLHVAEHWYDPAFHDFPVTLA